MARNPIDRIEALSLKDEVEVLNPKAFSVPAIQGRNIFDDILSQAVSALNGVSDLESKTNLLVNNYIVGKADISEVTVSMSKLSIAVQLATTTLTSAVTAFKEILQTPL